MIWPGDDCVIVRIWPVTLAFVPGQLKEPVCDTLSAVIPAVSLHFAGVIAADFRSVVK